MPTIEQAQQYYTAADPVHDFAHILRVLALAERIGPAEGADMEVLRAAVLLHDAAGATPDGEAGGGRASHHEASAEAARGILTAEGWPEDRIEAVLHCIRAHRFRGAEAPRTLEAQVLFDCDKLDVLGAIGVARAMAYAALAGQPLTGEPHTPYHEYLFKLRRVRDRLHTAQARTLAAERHRYLAEYFDRLAREVAGDA